MTDNREEETVALPQTNETETAIIITPPEGNQVLVRLPGHIDPKTITVDFRVHPQAVWTPSAFFEGEPRFGGLVDVPVQVRQQ